MKVDFSTPQRQDLRGIVVIYFTTLFKRLRQNIYALIPLLSQNIRENYLHYVVLGFIVLLGIQLVYSYKSYLNFKFHMNDAHFYLKEGIFKVSEIDIPFDRIQNININQNLIQQMLNVVGVEIETAGQGNAEISIKALKKEDANALKNKLLEQKHLQQESSLVDQETPSKVKSTSGHQIFKLDLPQLVKVGLSSNYLKGFGLVLAFGLTVLQFINDILTNFTGEKFDPDLDGMPHSSPYLVLSSLVFILVLSFLVTISSTVLKYFDLKVVQLKTDFEVQYGLIKRVNKVIKKEKTQVFETVENPISKFFKIKSLYVSQASSNSLRNKNKIGLVGVSSAEIQILFESLFDLNFNQTFILFHSNFRYGLRLLYRYLILCIAITAFTYVTVNPITGIGAGTVLLCLFAFLSFLQYKKSSLELNDDLIKINSGSIHSKQKYISIHKIQSVALAQNIFQQYNAYADLILYTASGTEKVQYISLEDTYKIINYLTFKTESTELSWI